MNDCISYGFSVPLVAATISSVTPLPNYFSSSPTSGMWDNCTYLLIDDRIAIQ
jgi:hypothetical protein